MNVVQRLDLHMVLARIERRLTQVHPFLRQSRPSRTSTQRVSSIGGNSVLLLRQRSSSSRGGELCTFRI